MGLDCSHDAWHGAYSAFHRWRQKIAEMAGMPPLDLMEGFYTPNDYRDPIRDAAARFEQPNQASELQRRLPIRWESLKPDPLHVLLSHSDCEGEIAPEDCGPIADRLEALLPSLDGDGGGHIGSYREKTEQFIRGLRRAASCGEAVDFH